MQCRLLLYLLLLLLLMVRLRPYLRHCSLAQAKQASTQESSSGATAGPMRLCQMLLVEFSQQVLLLLYPAVCTVSTSLCIYEHSEMQSERGTPGWWT